MLSKKNKIPYSLFTKLLTAKSFKGGDKNINIRIVSVNNTTLESRFSFVVSTKVSKLAVVRNKLKRHGYRAIAKHLNVIKPGYCIFFYFKKGSSNVSYLDVEDSIVVLLKNFKIISQK